MSVVLISDDQIFATNLFSLNNGLTLFNLIDPLLNISLMTVNITFKLAIFPQICLHLGIEYHIDPSVYKSKTDGVWSDHF